MMVVTRYLIALVFISSLLSISESKLAPWTPIDWKTLPPADPADYVEILYLVAPLLEESYGNLLAGFDAYHGAIAFRNLHNNLTITLNYDADDITRAALFPLIQNLPNGTVDLFWENDGANFIYMDINETYWDVYKEVVGVINGDGYNKFMEGWNAEVNTSYPFYKMFAIMDHFNGTTYYQSWNCFDYAWEAFNQLYAIGAEFDVSKSAPRDAINTYTSKVPVNVTHKYNTDPTFHASVVSVYEVLDNSKNMSWVEFIITLLEIVDGSFYIREATDYWEVDLSFPYFACDGIKAPLPGQTFEPIITRKSPLLKYQPQKLSKNKVNINF